MVSFLPKTASVPEAQLPPLTVFKDGTFGYRVRYRIVSEDANRFSHYSPVQQVRANYSFQRPTGKGLGDFVIIRQGPYINVVWEAVSVNNNNFNSFVKKSNEYDLWLSWSKGETNNVYIPADRVDGTLQGFIIPSSYQVVSSGTRITVQEEPTRLSVEIYVRATTQSRSNTALLVYKLDNANIEPPESPPAN
jgi:hypothetical protein